MEQVLTATVQIYPDEGQKELLRSSMSAYRDACNFVSEYVHGTGNLSQSGLNRALYRDIRDRFGLRSQMAQSVIRTVIGSYRSMRSNGHPDTQAVYRKDFTGLVWNRDYSLTSGGMFSVNTLSGRVKVPYAEKGMERYFDKAEYRFGTATLSENRGKFFLHISVEHTLPEAGFPKDICGVDLGMNFHAVSYDGSGKCRFYDGRAAKAKRRKFSDARRRLQMRKTPSARRRLKAIGERENRWMRDVNHCVSKALVTSAKPGTLFVLEDLSDIGRTVTDFSRRKRYVRSCWSYGQLAGFIRYKAEASGRQVLVVPAAYTSQRCPKCGYTAKHNRDKKRHVFCCKNCGYRSNDDRIGAMNLWNAGYRHLLSLQQ